MRRKKIYQEQGIYGSDDKDMSSVFSAFVLWGPRSIPQPEFVRAGLVSCGLPAEKRLALATIASAVSTLQYTSDALHASLVGSLVSMAMYRRPAMSVA